MDDTSERQSGARSANSATSHPEPSEIGEQTRTPRHRRRRLRAVGAVGLVLVITLVLLALLPTLLSTQPGNRTMIGWLNRQIAGSVEAESIIFGWLSGPEVTNLKLMDPEGRLVVDLPHLAAPQARPLSIAFGSSRYGEIDVRAHLLHVRQQHNEPTNLQLALASPEPEPEPVDPEPVRVDPAMSTRVQFSAERITYEGPDIEPVEMTDVTAMLDVTNIQSIGIDLQSALRHAEVDGRIAAQLRLSDMFTDRGELQWQRGGIEADMDLENLPVQAVDRLMQQEGRLAETLGESLNLHLMAAQAEQGRFAFQGRIQAPRLTGVIEGRWDQQAQEGELSTPTPLRLTLTPNAYQGWAGDLGARLALAEPMEATADLRIPRLGLRDPPEAAPADPLARLDPQRTSIAMDLTTPQLVVEDPQTQQRVSIANAEIQVPDGSLNEVIELFIRMRIEDLTGAPPPQPQPPADPESSAGMLESRTRVHDIVGPAGTLELTDARLVSEFTATRIPSQAVDMIAQQQGQLAAVLGPQTSAHATLEYQRRRGGEARAEVNSTNVNGALAAAIEPDGTARLTEDAMLSIDVTENVSQVMLSRFNPLLGHVVAATAPLSLRLRAEDSSIPIEPFQWQQLALEGELNIPRFTLRAAGFMDRAFQLMSVMGVLPRAAQYEALLTPAEFQIQQGLLSYDRLGIALADDLNLVFAGNVNLDTLRLDMDMRFMGDAYPREMRGLALPLGGTIDDPSLDTDRLAQLLVRHGIQRGLGELLPRRDEPEEEQDQEDEEPPRRPSPLEDLFDRLRR